MVDAPRFRHFAGIDWSGAVGERQKGIRVALCTNGNSAPALVRPKHIWSRAEVLDWIMHDLPPDTLVGLDLGTALPFFDRSGYFPEWTQSPPDARALWALVDRICAGDPHLSATSFVDHPDASRHFRRHGGRVGDLFPPGRGRWRLAEHAQAALGLSPVSNLNLVGAAQVGKSSLTGMRMLHRLSGAIPIWPFDRDPGHGSVVLEIYTTLAAREAGVRAGRSKLRDTAALNDALAGLGSEPVPDDGTIDDHSSDALLSAAWLRVAAARPELWHPSALTPEVARIEGWTFGAP
ncbi:hypothetical protein SAMN05216382_0257 [Sphingomonas palmae]|uniref:DUF429 domain-containing protein n=1 Tax=Sphingomonas palmae TaxID=1855283 RepID=A0A1H7GCN9_9SPHN|nr:hypothetical protein [Sphingomonas palmae]SEK36046.1 hypothetical protein SAMN05216382_0257 [Sphingomonas palmae]